MDCNKRFVEGENYTDIMNYESEGFIWGVILLLAEAC